MPSKKNKTQNVDGKIADLKALKKQKSSTFDEDTELIKLLEEKLSQVQKKLGANQKKAEKLERTLSGYKERMVATVHDLKVPVTITLLNLELAETEEDPDEKAAFLVSIRRELEFLIDTIGNTLDLEKAEDGKLVYLDETLDLQDIFNHLLTRMDVLVRDRPGLALVNELPRQLPVIQGDKNKFIRIFNNLFSNAIKYTDHGTITIGGSWQKKKGVLNLYVSDTGSGIEPELLPRIFQFFEGDKAHPESSGVGLAFVKNVLRTYKGTISIKSQKGHGTTVNITLPCE